ncbi:MAG: FAD-binding oxidoreductase [Bdellovibrionota bacterium]
MRHEKTKWYGWGSEGHFFGLEKRGKLQAYLKKHGLLKELKPKFSAPIESVKCPKSSLPPEMLSRLAKIVGEDSCNVTDQARVRNAAGKSYRDLLNMRSLKLGAAPDVLICPANEEQIKNILNFCGENEIAVVPFGGGSSVVGGVEPERGSFRYLAALNTARLDRVLDIDKKSMTAKVEAGIYGPQLESALGQHGFMLGHFPQSFEFSTLGGWIAARSSGQNSILYGGIEDMVVALDVVSPIGGTVRTLYAPRHACGPDIKEIFVGSEGTLGLISSATLRISRIPEVQDYSMYIFSSFEEASEAARAVAQSGCKPAMVRVSDEEESLAMFAMSGGGHGFFSGLISSAAKTYFGLRGVWLSKGFSVMLVGFEGGSDEVERAKTAFIEIMVDFKCVGAGSSPGKKWLKERFELPYLRDDLMDNGLFVETLETATTWSNFQRLYNGVREAVDAECGRQNAARLIFTHISHLYHEGASLYFTIIARKLDDDPLGQWRSIKEAASTAIVANSGVISHHHGIGIDHKSHLHWGVAEHGMIKGVKSALDPNGIMNPLKLFDVKHVGKEISEKV